MSYLIGEMKQELEEEVWGTDSYFMWALNRADGTYLKILNIFFFMPVFIEVFASMKLLLKCYH